MTLPARGSALLLVNPAAGRGRATRLYPAVAEALRVAGYAPRIVVTDSLAGATASSREAPSGTLVAALGGDGFLGAAATGASASGAVLLPLAGGRGNDTVRRFRLGSDPVRTVQKIPRLVVRPTDLGQVNGHPFLGVANVGLDGLANEHGNSTALNLGSLSYLYGGLKAFRGWQDVTFTVTTDGRQTSSPGWFVAVGNVGQYGGGLRICPAARADDGLLDVVSLGRTSIPRVVTTFLRAFAGSHLGQPGVTSSRGTVVTISADRPLNVYADGEWVGSLPATVEILPAAVRVLVARDSPAFASD